MGARQLTSTVFLIVAFVFQVACGPGDDGPPEDVDAGGTGMDGATPDAGPEACVHPSHLVLRPVPLGTRFDPGWTGFGHGSKFTDGTVFTAEITECDADCRRCRLRGPVKNSESTGLDNQRCRADPTTVCSSDAECGAGDSCVFYYGPPIDSQVNCSQIIFRDLASGADTSALQGVFDLFTGELNLSAFNFDLTFNPSGSCPVCVGDSGLSDGQKDGTCRGVTPNAGQPCDVAGTSVTTPGLVSFDCPPTGLYPAGFPLAVHPVSSTGEVWRMDSTRPMCTLPGTEGAQCWCGACSGTGAACAGDSDCGGGTCGWAGDMSTYVGVSAPNACADGVCNWDPGSRRGSCLADTPMGPFPVGCFPNTGEIRAVGGAEIRGGVYYSLVAGMRCFPSTGSPELDQIFGYPGMAFYEVQFEVRPEWR